MAEYLGFFILLDVLLISRLVYILGDEPISKKNLVAATVILTTGIFIFEFSLVLLVFFLVLIGGGIGFYFLENKSKFKLKLNRLRLISLSVSIFITGLLFAPWAEIKFNPGIPAISNFLSDYLIFFGGQGTDWEMISIIVFGTLLVTGEANLLIRYVFQVYNLTPKSDNQTTDVDEYNAGRVIGILERILIYYLVLNSEFGAIGFILAAKSFTRFKDLDKRSFAEYVLIGTLLSTMTAMVIAGYTIWLLPE